MTICRSQGGELRPALQNQSCLLFRSTCWRNTWSSSWWRGSPASTWTLSQSGSCKMSRDNSPKKQFYSVSFVCFLLHQLSWWCKWCKRKPASLFNAPVAHVLLQHATRWHKSTLKMWLDEMCGSFISRQQKEEVPGDIFDMLLTFTDFIAFKEMFLEYRNVSGKTSLNFFLIENLNNRLLILSF